MDNQAFLLVWENTPESARIVISVMIGLTVLGVAWGMTLALVRHFPSLVQIVLRHKSEPASGGIWDADTLREIFSRLDELKDTVHDSVVGAAEQREKVRKEINDELSRQRRAFENEFHRINDDIKRVLEMSMKVVEHRLEENERICAIRHSDGDKDGQ